MTDKKKEKNYYIDKKEFHTELVEYNKTGIVSEKLHLMFWLLAKNIARKSRFYGYTFKEDMITEAYMRCVRYAGSFNTELSNPYSYFTQLIHNKFQDMIWDEHDQQAVKWQYLKKQVKSAQEIGNEYQYELNSSIKDKINNFNYSKKRSGKAIHEEDID